MHPRAALASSRVFTLETLTKENQFTTRLLRDNSYSLCQAALDLSDSWNLP